MSSHHIVKDDQEPALIIQAPISNLEHLKQLLEWSPTVISSYEALDWLLTESINIDVLICTEAELSSATEKLQHQLPVKFLTFHSLEKGIIPEAISFLTYAKYGAAHIIGPFKADLLQQTPLSIGVIWSDDLHQWALVKHGNYKKWYNHHQQIVLLEEPAKIAGNYTISHEAYCYLETQSEGILEIQNSDPFWIGEPISD
ncbi:hypothetical protein LVD15_05955 [Fulvivirga maritima]|uniref:hypothetical protein n=1 Tax=Fulvivirga maritima TaxID=2904247 RepID=UPI001F21CD24|nr:hypothetical protein [Fulvivirga maritima]UII27964.1 hypothetical protein LVD15_05955 [Fulvivirga maritima]